MTLWHGPLILIVPSFYRLWNESRRTSFPPGDKLPSVRDLAAEASVNPNTMQKAFAELERTGLVYSRRTSGRFITEDCHMIEQLKTSLATEKMEEFLAQLGFQNDEILSLMNQTMKGEKQ